MPIVTNTEYKIKGKKRQRANVPHKPVGPETKVFYAVNSTNSPSDDAAYATFYPHPAYYTTQDLSTKNWNMWPYELKQLMWPAQGAGSAQRVGNKITAKLMRFKGLFRVYYNLVRPMRIRLYYIYYKAHSFVNTSVTHLKDYTSPLTYNTDAAGSFPILMNNYYNGQWRDVYLNTPEFYKTKVGEWYIKPSSPILAPGQLISSRYSELQAQNSPTEGVQWIQANAYNTCAYFIPFDKTVYLNQEVLCNQDTHYLYWEVDSASGVANSSAIFFAASVSPNAHTPLEVITAAEPPVACQFKLIYYFQDD